MQQRGGRVRSLAGRLEGLEERLPESVDVGSRLGGLGAPLLGRHICERTFGLRCAGELASRKGDAEVRQDDAIVFSKQEVARFEVSMDE